MDTVTVVGPATRELVHELQNQGARQERVPETGDLLVSHEWGSAHLPAGLATVHVRANTKRGLFFRAEWSVPEMLDGHNVYPVNADMLSELIDMGLTELGGQLPGVPNVEQVEPYRIDIVKDFCVTSPATTMAQIAQHPLVRGAHDQRAHRQNGDLQDLSRGSLSQWISKTYAKQYQLEDKARRAGAGGPLLLAWVDVTDGMLRTEMQARRGLLSRRGIWRIMDATPEALDQLGQELFSKGRLDVVTGGSAVLVHRLQEIQGEGLTTAKVRALQLYLIWSLVGGDFPGGKGMFQTGRALANKYGLTGSSMISDEEPRRLDYASGLELVGADALRMATETPQVSRVQ